MRLSDEWRPAEIGAGEVRLDECGICLSIPAASKQQYHDAQITDYAPTRPRFQRRPPVRMSVEARARGGIRGTAGFGFWNHAFEPGRRRIRPPQALWFFYGSPPNNIALARGVAGQGWKAAAINARRWPFFALLPLALPAFLLMRNRRFYETFWPSGQRAIGVHEAWLDAAIPGEFHSYVIEWRERRATFLVDDQTVLTAPVDIAHPLGFIAWIDNQYAIATPQGQFGWGKLEVEAPQSLQLRNLEFANLTGCAAP